MIRAVLFDFGQTLADSADGFRAAEKTLQAHVREQVGSVPAPTFLERYRRMRTEFQAQSNFSRRALAKAVLDAYGTAADANRIAMWEREYWDTVRQHTRPFPDASAVLRRLARRFALGLVTNAQADPGRHRIFDRFPLLDVFRAVVVAGEGSVPCKPDPRPFHRCLAQLDCAPDEAVFVGDDPRIDIEGARNAGLHAVWLRRPGRRHPPDPLPPDVPVIESLGELSTWPGFLTSPHSSREIPG